MKINFETYFIILYICSINIKQMGREITREKPSTLSGMTKYQAQRIAKYAFGEYFDSFKVDFPNFLYVISVKKQVDGEPIDQGIIDYFQEFWGAQWKIRILNIED